jgi:uncharacterized protein (TIGR02246 family)
MTTTDEAEIRDVVTTWAAAIRACDLDGVLAAHDRDIVMFDVPPPYRGVRGIDDYRASWPPFFAYIGQGAQFEIEELEVTAGADVAFGWALLRCGKPEEFAANPDNRLRVTVGLRKVDGSWRVTHEHHSFPMRD